MKYNYLIILFFNIICCYSTIYEKIKIENIDTTLIINDEDKKENIISYHLYFENIKKKDKSFGINYSKSNVNFKISLFPGIYNIYVYGIIDKTTSTKKVYSYYIKKNKNFFQNNNILINLKTLNPNVELLDINNQPSLKIYFNEIYDIFSLSSLSLKQSTDRVKSLDFIFNNYDKSYIANITPNKNGDWYYNISYKLKSKIEENVLKKDNIDLSTSNFSSIYLGNYQFIK